MTQELTHIHPACDASAINDLLVAAVAALGAAIQTDLPPMTVLAPAPGANDDLPQNTRRDLYAAERLYGVCFGAMRAVTRRPGIADTQTLIIPQSGGHKIIILCVSGAAVVYAPDGRGATLDAIFHAVAKEKMQEWIGAARARQALGMALGMWSYTTSRDSAAGRSPCGNGKYSLWTSGVLAD